MNKIHFTDEDGFITGSQVSNTAYEDGKSYSAGSICRILPTELINKDIAELSSYQFFDGAFIKRAVRPTDYMTTWDSVTQTWVADVTSERVAAWSLLKTALYDFITISSAFPIWRQVNYSQTFNELTLKNLTSVLTLPEQETLNNIVLVHAWKNDLLAEAAKVKETIFLAADPKTIKSAGISFSFTPPPFTL